MKKIKISKSCEPYMYTSEYDLKTINIGDVIEVKFQNKSKVKKEFLGKTLKFFVNNILDYSFYGSYRRIAIIPLEKINDFTKKDAIIIDQTDRFSCLMIDLYPENRRPFSGWKNKIVDINVIPEKIDIPKPEFTFNKNLKMNHTGSWYHINNYSFMSNIWGGVHEDTVKFFKKHEGDPKLKMNGFIVNEMPINWIDNPHDLLRDYLTLSLTFGDKPKRVYAPLITEYEEEFCIRREFLMNLVLEHISKIKYKTINSTDGIFAVWDYATNSNNKIIFEKCLDKYGKEDINNILTNLIEYLDHKKKRGW